MVEKKSVLSIKKAIKDVLGYKNQLKEIAYNNRSEALGKYRTSIYQGAILEIFNDFFLK